MKKTLQKRFVRTSMLAISILLIVLLGGINGMNYVITGKETEQILGMLVDTQGLYTPPETGNFEPESGSLPPGRFPSPDEMLGSRYFVVFWDTDGGILFIDTSHIYAVTEEEAGEIAERADLKEGETGRSGQLAYRCAQAPNDKGRFAVFLDISSRQKNRITVALVSIVGGMTCWILMLILVILLSRRAIRPIAENMEKQKQFVTNAGHEIKTPLAIILTNTDALELHLGENKWSRNIRLQTERLAELMQNLLTLARLDEDGRTLPMAECSLTAMLEETLQLFDEAAEAKNIDIDFQLQGEVLVRGNRESLLQLFSILLDNAVKYTPVSGKISVMLERTGASVRLQVKNTLAAAENMEPERLFERFYRGDAARTRGKSGGYGIGLSAARAITEAHKGSIKASFADKKKAIVFTVIL